MLKWRKQRSVTRKREIRKDERRFEDGGGNMKGKKLAREKERKREK